MASDNPPPISPHYGVDLRALVDQAFGSFVPVPAGPVPGGTIGERIQSPAPSIAPPLVACREAMQQDAPSSEVRIVTAAEYWALALPHRWLVLGPLLDLAGLDIEAGERLDVEQRLLGVYYRRYQSVPLPPNVLALLRELAVAAPAARLSAWLDAAREETMHVAQIEEAMVLRRELRLEALRLGATGEWDERMVSVAELMTDLLALCRAARDDVERAFGERWRSRGSVSLAFRSIDEAQDTTFERTLSAVLRPALTEDDLADDERERILAFAATRPPRWRDGLLGRGFRRVTVTIHQITDRTPPPARASGTGEIMEAGETASESYRRIRDALEERIIARPELCRRLALVGTAHLHGVTHQRVLLCGPTGSGKTHGARALADAIGRPFLQIDMSDVTATGWRGADLPSVLSALALRAGGKLAGAVLQLDEIDKVRIGKGVEGNSLEAKANLQASLLGLLDGQPVTPDSAGNDQVDTSNVLVLGTGAFAGRFVTEPPSTRDLVRWGWTPELAARWGERLVLSPPGRSEAVELLRSSERSVKRRLGPLTSALGIRIEVPEAVLAYVADRWLRTGSDYRSAAEWLLSAARTRLIEALEQGGEDTIVLTPDDIVVSRRSLLRRGGSP